MAKILAMPSWPEDSAIIGIRFADGSIKLNPPMDTVLGAADQLIAVSEDDDTVELAANIRPPD